MTDTKTGEVTNQDKVNDWQSDNTKSFGVFTMTIAPYFWHSFWKATTASKVWKALKEKYSTSSTNFKYLNFKALMDTTIPEDQHLQAAFSKLHCHLHLLQDFNTEVPATL